MPAYVVSVYAEKPEAGKSPYWALGGQVVFTNSEEEARSWGLKCITDMQPESDGWTNYRVAVSSIPKDFIFELLIRTMAESQRE